MNTRSSAGTILGWAMRGVIAVSCCAPLFFPAQQAYTTAAAPIALSTPPGMLAQNGARTAAFAAGAREKKSVSVGPKSRARAVLFVGR